MCAVVVERGGGILEITLDRPPANAIDSAASRELGRALVDYGADPELRVAIVTGAGDRFFSAGWDLHAAAAGDSEDWGPGGFAGLTELFELRKPVIAAVNGYAAGGGLELALACDLIVAAEGARFSLPEVRRGIVADAGGVLRLPRRIPRALAMEMLLTGEPIDAGRAAQIGLVNSVVPRSRLLEGARALAGRILAGAPLAIEAVKAIDAETEHLDVPEAFARLRDGAVPEYQRCLASEDAREGPLAFSQDRDPEWSGR